MTDFWSEIAEHGRDLGRRIVGRYIEDGFKQAGDICGGVVQERMDELRSKAPSGKMTAADQMLWSKLGELKAEMDNRLREQAERGDWRPL